MKTEFKLFCDCADKKYIRMTDNMNIRLWHRKFQDGIMLSRYFEIENIYKNHHIWMGDQTIFNLLKTVIGIHNVTDRWRSYFLEWKKIWLDFLLILYGKFVCSFPQK